MHVFRGKFAYRRDLQTLLPELPFLPCLDVVADGGGRSSNPYFSSQEGDTSSVPLYSYNRHILASLPFCSWLTVDPNNEALKQNRDPLRCGRHFHAAYRLPGDAGVLSGDVPCSPYSPAPPGLDPHPIWSVCCLQPCFLGQESWPFWPGSVATNAVSQCLRLCMRSQDRTTGGGCQEGRFSPECIHLSEKDIYLDSSTSVV
ncbi:hypothetical protein GN956_G18290 [Arapaima gigas]